MHLTFDPSVTAQQRQWFQDAIAASTRDWDETLPDEVGVRTVAEPSCPGHKDYMCTTLTGHTGDIQIRVNADDPAARINEGLPNPIEDVKPFFMESVIHELCHVITFEAITSNELKTEVAACFTKRDATGEGTRTGVLADWNPLDKPWGDRIQEAVAEVLKDTFMPDFFKVYDNRSNWNISADVWANFCSLLGVGGSGSPGGGTGPDISWLGRTWVDTFRTDKIQDAG